MHIEGENITFSNTEEAQRRYEEREKMRLDVSRQIQKQENILTTIKVLVVIIIIGVFIILGIKYVPKAINNIMHTNDSEITVTESVTNQIQPLYPDEPIYFENTPILNYHRWFGGNLVKNDSGVIEGGISYQRYIYSYDNEEYPEKYESLLINDGFEIVKTETPNKEEKIIIKGYQKINSGESIKIQVSTYFDRHTISIMFHD